jgi:ecotin
MKAFTVLVLFLSASLLPAQDKKDPAHPFPAAEDGQERFVIRLPKLDDESARKVELIVGKNVETDPVNSYSMAGKIERKSLKGWGYSYYVAQSSGQMMGTLIAPPPGAKKVKRFITIRGGDLLRYNSKLPLVVYAPKGFEVRYRIWSAGEKTNHGKKE